MNCNLDEIRNAAALKIQNMIRRAIGHTFVAREKVSLSYRSDHHAWWREMIARYVRDVGFE